MVGGTERSGAFWSLVAWGAAMVAGIVVGWLAGWLAGAPAGLIFGVVAFVLVGFLVDYNFGPEPGDEAHPQPAQQGHHHRHAEAVPVAPAAAAPGVAGLERVPYEATPGIGISERVREAARAAGEAARAAVGDSGARGGGGVPSPVMGEGVPPRPDPEPLPPGPVPPEPVPVPPDPLPPGPIAGDEARPAGLDGPREGRADDLKRIRGVGPKLEDLLHRLGFWHFDQIAAWTDAEVAWVDSHLEGFNGRATRDDWVGQARILAGGGETGFSRRVDRGEVY